MTPVTKKITEKMLKWYRHVKRKEEGHVLRRIVDAQVLYLEIVREEDRKSDGDSCKRDVESLGLKVEDVYWTGKSERDIILYSKPQEV